MSDEEPELELELLEVGVVGVVVVVLVGVGVDVCVGVDDDVVLGSGASGLVDVDVGAGGVVLEVADVGFCAEVGAELGGSTPGAEDWPSVGRCRSRFAASPALRTASAFAAAAAAFESCDAASALLRRPSWCRWNAVATPPLTARTLVTAAAVLTLPFAWDIAPGLAWLATCLPEPEPDMPDKRDLPPNFAS
jgi:hypothetical protein